MNNVPAPIVLFVYNRPWHTQQTVEALQKNKLASESELFIYSDDAKNDDARVSVDEVRKYIDNITGFKKITVIKRDKNWGLASSIIDGVTKIVNKYGRIIVLEDDLVTSPYFLKFMNDSLEVYEKRNDVFSVTGFNYPKSIFISFLFLMGEAKVPISELFSLISFSNFEISSRCFSPFEVISFCLERDGTGIMILENFVNDIIGIAIPPLNAEI